jgi:peptide/nickel transport system substrate-binding protein
VTRKKQILAAAGAGVLLASLAACGGNDNGGNGGTAGSGAGEPWILGTTDSVTALDPAGSYDLGSSTLEYNLYQTLLTVPANSTEIVGDAAKSCEYDDPQTLTCTLNEGLKFSNGDELTSSDSAAPLHP